MIWRYLVTGSTEQYLPKAWLADHHRLALYQAAHAKELWAGGSVVRTVADMRHEAFWQAHAAYPPQPALVFVPFRKLVY